MKQLLLTRERIGQPPGILRPGKNNVHKLPFNFFPFLLALLIVAAIVWKLMSGYQEKALTIEDIEKSLSPEELEAYKAAQKEVDDKFENCIQYILYALEDGIYECLSCPPGIPFVTLKEGEIWYIGHTCQDDNNRHSRSFRQKHNVWLYTNYVGPKEECHKIELKLIRGYQFLPESFKPEAKLIIPPYNRTDKN